jgi:hypothetical protein
MHVVITALPNAYRSTWAYESHAFIYLLEE